ncbi:CHASE2 domain-containing protein [Burkholderia dolosa]|nr:CHASE2 domain-containing protein [Burkholderia dolosa]
MAICAVVPTSTSSTTSYREKCRPMFDWFRRAPRFAASVRAAWLPLIGTPALAALSCTASVEALFSPLDRIYWHAVSSNIDRGRHHKVAVIAVDKKTVDELGGNASYARTGYASILSRVSGAASVVLDITMVTPTQHDDLLAAAIAAHGRVVLPAEVSPVHGRADTVILPARRLREAAAALGQRSVVLSSDDLVQGIVPYVTIGNGDEIPHVGLQAIRIAKAPLPENEIRSHVQPHVTRMGHVEDGSILLRLPLYFHLDRYSFVDVLKGRVPASAWRNRIVFIGDGMSELSGVFHLSSGSDGRVHRVEVDALATEAVLDGRLLRNVPLGMRIAISTAVASGMLLICMLVPGRRLYGFALGWLAAYVASQALLLAHGAYWAPVGPSLAMCVTVFALCGWRRAGSLSAALMREYRRLRGMAGRHAIGSAEQPVDAGDALPDEEVAEAISRIREWQSTYVDVIHTLPYPIFIEHEGTLLMCNERGRAMLASIDVDGTAAVRQVIGTAYHEIRAAKETGRIHSAELTLNARTYMAMVTPFDDGDHRRSTASMISLVDIHNIKAAVESDRMTLRHMAHDLRNPLSTVLSLLEQHSSGGVSDPDFLANLHKLVNYSLRVAQDFTQLSRAEHLDRTAYVMVSASDLAMEAIDQVWHSASAKHICVEGPNDDGHDAFVLGNRDMLLRALTNLLDNAVKYSNDGTVVSVWIRTGDGDVSIAVEDQGIGIPADAMPRLFEPFFQAGGACRDPSRGVGLGLPFVKTVVERHGGSVDVTSTPGEGSRFSMCLPTAAAEAERRWLGGHRKSAKAHA